MAVAAAATGGAAPSDIDGWAVHAGGRSILDAVQRAFALPADALDASREAYFERISGTDEFVVSDVADHEVRSVGDAGGDALGELDAGDVNLIFAAPRSGLLHGMAAH